VSDERKDAGFTIGSLSSPNPGDVQISNASSAAGKGTRDGGPCENCKASG